MPSYLGPVFAAPWNAAPWNAARWPHFRPHEIACHCCGEICVDPAALDALERMRRMLGAPLRISSGHRCAIHNALVGGAPLSRHKKLAFDIALAAHDPAQLLAAARAGGFSGFGFGQSFLHCDLRARPQHWFYGRISCAKWSPILEGSAA